MSTFGDIRNNFQIAMNRAINESNSPVWVQNSSKAYYDAYPESNGGRFINPKKSEIIRAYFGSEDIEEEIMTFLELHGIKSEYYNGDLTPANKSGSFDSWELTLNTDCQWFGKNLKSGETWYIINAKKVSNSGVIAVIGDKDTAPKTMGLTDILFSNKKNAVDVTKQAVTARIKDVEYANFMNELVEVVSNYKPSKTFDDVLGLAVADNDYEIPYDFSKWGDSIDKISIANIAKDFGEVLGGILTFNLIKNVDSGLIFPAASNEAVVDFKFDNLNISSKAGKGGKASASGFLRKVKTAQESENWKLSPEEKQLEKGFIDVILAKQSEPKNKLYYSGAGSGTYSNTVKLFNLHLDRNSAWNYWISESGMPANNSNRDDMVKSFIDLRDMGKLHKTLNGYAKKIGGFGSLGGKTAAAKFTASLINAKNENEASNVLDAILKDDNKDSYDAIVGLIMYGCSKQLVDVLNSKFGDTLTGMINKAIGAKQLYLNVNIKKNTIKFQMKSMKTGNFKIEELNGVNSWSQRGLAITLK